MPSDNSEMSYEPLFKTLAEKGMVLNDLRKGRSDVNLLHPTTISKINQNKPISMEQIAKLCVVLNVPIEKVVKVNI